MHQNNRPEDEATTSADLHKLSTEINEKYGKHAAQVQHLNEPAIVVDYREAKAIKLSLQDRVALWLASDVILLTHIREGLNLLPLEYIYARKDQAYAGVVVISEFSTCSSLLNGSIKINPFSSSSVADAIDKALSMSTKNCNARRARDLIFVSTHPSSLWTKQILGDLDQLHAGVAVAGNSALKRHHDSLTSKSTAALNNLSSSVTGNQAVRMPEPLDFDSVLKWYEASVK